jgi:hypothetical protein
MRKFRVTGALISMVFAAIAYVDPAQAQATRTWVSGIGDDANPCSRTAPCKTFAGAISKTAAPGEINCLDPGGFGAVTITKSIAIICQVGTAGVLVSGTNGITISAATTDIVYLSGLDFEGLNTSPSGIQITTAAAVHIVNCIIRGFNTAGINVAPTGGGVEVDVIDSIIADNPAPATGILARPTGGANVRMVPDRTRITNNGGDGVAANGNAGSGSVKISVRDSEASNNTGNGFSAFSSMGVAQQQIDSSTAANNGVGIAVTGTNAIIRFTRSTVTANGTGVSGTATSILSYGTNSVDGNGAPGTFGMIPQE